MAKNVYFGAGGNHRVKAITFRAGSNRKVIRGWIGIGGSNHLFFDDSIEAGHYWLIDADGTKEYNANGTLVKSNSTKTSWTCPSAGNYSIELHARGGSGGAGEGDSWVASDAASAGGGGGGGGSGVRFDNVNLSAQAYSIELGTSRTTFGSYYVNNGGNGGDGYASNWTGRGGSGGSTATYSPSTGVNLASYGQSGEGDGSHMSSWASASGGRGGSGGSSIGSYGDGGDGGDATQSGGDYGQSGRPGAIIIRKL